MTELQPSSTYIVWQGIASLLEGSTRHDLRCRILVKSDGDLQIFAENQSGDDPIGIGNQVPLSLTIPNIIDDIPILITGSSVSSDGLARYKFTPKQVPIWVLKPGKLLRARAAIVNFDQYTVAPSDYGRFSIAGAGWDICFIPVSERILSFPASVQSEQYKVTHQIEFGRSDKSLFTSAEARTLLERLCIFLSFCRESWVAFSLSVGFTPEGEIGFEQWGFGRASSWRKPESWLDLHHGKGIVQLYSDFANKLEDKSWSNVLRHITYWLLNADIGNIGPDGACILLQAALERLAWHLIVRERKALSEDGFEKLAAADKLRLMLNILQVPTSIPEGLSELNKYARSKGLDGPGIFTHIRNRLVHPPKPSAESQLKVPYYEAYCLAKWYVELSTLSACHYRGEYSNCTRKIRWLGEVETVPWVTNV